MEGVLRNGSLFLLAVLSSKSAAKPSSISSLANFRQQFLVFPEDLSNPSRTSAPRHQNPQPPTQMPNPGGNSPPFSLELIGSVPAQWSENQFCDSHFENISDYFPNTGNPYRETAVNPPPKIRWDIPDPPPTNGCPTHAALLQHGPKRQKLADWQTR
jgi:hypothetical protein